MPTPGCQKARGWPLTVPKECRPGWLSQRERVIGDGAWPEGRAGLGIGRRQHQGGQLVGRQATPALLGGPVEDVVERVVAEGGGGRGRGGGRRQRGERRQDPEQQDDGAQAGEAALHEPWTQTSTSAPTGGPVRRGRGRRPPHRPPRLADGDPSGPRTGGGGHPDEATLRAQPPDDDLRVDGRRRRPTPRCRTPGAGEARRRRGTGTARPARRPPGAPSTASTTAPGGCRRPPRRRSRVHSTRATAAVSTARSANGAGSPGRMSRTGLATVTSAELGAVAVEEPGGDLEGGENRSSSRCGPGRRRRRGRPSRRSTVAARTVGPPPSTWASHREPTKPSRWRVSPAPPSLSAASTSAARDRAVDLGGPASGGIRRRHRGRRPGRPPTAARAGRAVATGRRRRPPGPTTGDGEPGHDEAGEDPGGTSCACAWTIGRPMTTLSGRLEPSASGCDPPPAAATRQLGSRARAAPGRGPGPRSAPPAAGSGR